jgi:hypothetical protein
MGIPFSTIIRSTIWHDHSHSKSVRRYFKYSWSHAGIDMKFKGAFYSVLISPVLVPELNQLKLTEDGLVVGAVVTLTKLATKLKELQTLLPEQKTRGFTALLEMLRWFAGRQIRNVAVSITINRFLLQY